MSSENQRPGHIEDDEPIEIRLDGKEADETKSIQNGDIIFFWDFWKNIPLPKKIAATYILKKEGFNPAVGGIRVKDFFPVYIQESFPNRIPPTE
jgi:hypothetical protein